MKIITSIKSVGGSKVIILPKNIKDFIGDDVLVSVTFEKYQSSRQEQFNQYIKTNQEISISFNNTIITGKIVSCDAEKVRIKQADDTYIIFYRDIDNVDIPSKLKDNGIKLGDVIKEPLADVINKLGETKLK